MQVGLQKIVVLGTGGTIAGTASSATDSSDYVAAQKAVGDLLAGLPPPPGCEVVCEQVAQIDSKDMDPAVWQRLLQRCQHWQARDDVLGIVITHGTDTLEETAWLLQALLAPAKPLVLTCAMRPATAIDADGPQNLLDAMAVAACPGARGVVAVCAGRIHSALDVQKVHTWRLDAYSSGDAGAVGQVRQGRVERWRDWPVAAPLYDSATVARIIAAPVWPRVEIVFSHGGASGAMVDALLDSALARRLGAPVVRGLVVAGTGGGTVHQAMEAALRRALVAGVPVWRSTRCATGSLRSRDDDEFPVAPASAPVKARLALMLELLAQPERRADH